MAWGSRPGLRSHDPRVTYQQYIPESEEQQLGLPENICLQLLGSTFEVSQYHSTMGLFLTEGAV